MERHGIEHRVISGADCFCGKMSELFVPSQEHWAVTESLNQPSPGVILECLVLVTKRALSERENSCSFDLLKPLRALLVMMSLELWSFSPRLLTWSTLMQGALWDLPFLERTQSAPLW